MWLVLTICSAVLLGVYDVAKKQSLKKNGVFWVLFVTTLISTALMAPFCKMGPVRDLVLVAVKSSLVAAAWIFGLAAMKLLPLTTLSTLKASRPVFVILFSMILFGERLSALQWVGVAVTFLSLWLLSRASSKEGFRFSGSRGIAYMLVCIFAGVASALLDKYVARAMPPTFVQFWSYVFITLITLACLIVQRFAHPADFRPLRWDWTLVVIAVLSTGADACYFFALNDPDSMLSIVSLMRRSAVIVTFLLSALLFKEKQLKSKGLALAVMLCGMVILFLAS